MATCSFKTEGREGNTEYFLKFSSFRDLYNKLNFEWSLVQNARQDKRFSLRIISFTLYWHLYFASFCYTHWCTRCVLLCCLVGISKSTKYWLLSLLKGHFRKYIQCNFSVTREFCHFLFTSMPWPSSTSYW